MTSTEPITAERGAPPAPDRTDAGAATARRATGTPPRRRLRFLLLGLIAAAAIIGGVLWWLEARQYVSTDDAFIDVHMVRMAPQVAGRVRRVLVDDNQLVTAGQKLVELDPADYQARLAQAQASQASAQGKLAQARAQRQVSQANLDQARAEVGVAEANATNAATDLRRFQDLARTHSPALSQQQFDTATANAKSTAATLNAAQKKTAAAQAQLGLADSQIATAEADLQSAAAQVEQARLDLSYTEIAAPLAGRVTKKNVSPGDYLQAGQNLMALVPTTVWVTANFKETQLDHMRIGQSVSIHVDAYPDKEFHGHIDSIQAGSGAAFALLPPENATGNYVKVVQRVPVKIVFDAPDDPDHPLGPGMSVVPSVKIR
jgi:membrane fusion protein (multidrug efflux system)